MFAQLTQPNVWHALLAGLGYAMLYALISQVAWHLARWLRAQLRPSAVRLQRWPGWLWVGSLGAILGTLAYGFVLAIRGVLATGDLGIGAVDWATLPWALGIVCGAALWLGVLWALMPSCRSSRTLAGGWAGLLLSSLAQEGHAAIWRAALMPWLGTYWGVWLAVPCKLLTTLADPAQRQAGLGQRHSTHTPGAPVSKPAPDSTQEKAAPDSGVPRIYLERRSPDRLFDAAQAKTALASGAPRIYLERRSPDRLFDATQTKAALASGAPRTYLERRSPDRLFDATQTKAALASDAPLDSATVLGWALDWVSAALFFYSHSLWLTLAGRALCGSLLWLVQRKLSRRGNARASAHDQSQDDQHSEHGSGQDADALEVA